ncbi:MAG: GNAT family N-acetyltransferase [Pseudomonas mandelii]
MTLRIEQSLNPTDEERQAILLPLRAYNASKAGVSTQETFALLVRDENGEILGGLYGRVFYQWMFIDLLSVPEQARGQGLGSRLMRMAEDLAREKECAGIWLDTFDFQAPEFYKKLGYSEFGQIVDYPPGHKRFFFQKRLINDA